MTAALLSPWQSGEARQQAPERQFVLGAGNRLVSRAGLKAELREVERRIGRSPSPWTDDLVQLATLGAAVTEAGPRGGRWLQRSRAEGLVTLIEHTLRSTSTPRTEDFIRLVLAAAAASRGQPRPSRGELSARYQALVEQIEDATSSNIDDLMALAKAGAWWAQAGPQQPAFQLREQLQALKLRVLALRAPQPDDFIQLAVLEVAVQAVERKESHPLA